jgi:hemerythrin-like domain-containing protein
MKRYNIFYEVHKGLRSMLYETAIQIQQTDFINNDEAELMLEQIKNLVELFDKHAKSEDRFVFTAVEPYEPAVADTFEQEHVKDHALGENLGKQLTAFSNIVPDDEKMRSGQLLYQAFIEFMIFNLQHMAKEEDVINKVLWRHYTDEQLKAITADIIANIPPVQMAQFTKWMMRGLSNNEIAGWLKEVKNTAPDFVFNSLMQTAAAELNIHRLQLVQEAITEGAMVA